MQIPTLRSQARQELLRLKVIIDNEVELLLTLDELNSREGLGVVEFVREDLRQSAETARHALNRLSSGMTEQTITPDRSGRGKLPGARSISVALLGDICVLRLELNRSQTRLLDRERQITSLIEAGFELAFRKELLEEEVAKLRHGVNPECACTASL